MVLNRESLAPITGALEAINKAQGSTLLARKVGRCGSNGMGLGAVLFLTELKILYYFFNRFDFGGTGLGLGCRTITDLQKY